MALPIGQFFRLCNPSRTLDLGKPEDAQYYIDFTEVRGNNVVNELKRTSNSHFDKKLSNGQE